jgi:hypothetical protein
LLEASAGQQRVAAHIVVNYKAQPPSITNKKVIKPPLTASVNKQVKEITTVSIQERLLAVPLNHHRNITDEQQANQTVEQ